MKLKTRGLFKYFIFLLIIGYLLYLIPYKTTINVPCVLYDNEYKLKKKAQMSLELKVYRKILMRNHIKCKFKIKDEIFDVETGHYVSLIEEFKSKLNEDFYRFHSISWENHKAQPELNLLVSKDFNFFNGSKYKDGDKINFVAPANSMVEGAELLERYLRWKE